MKKTIVFFALFSVLSMAMFAHEVSAELGVLPNTNTVNWNQKAITSEFHLENVLYLDLGVQFDLPHDFFVGGGTKAFMLTQKNDSSFYPFYVDYRFNVGWSWNWLTLGYEHDCAHSIDALGYIVKEPILGRDCSSDRIYAKVKFEF